MNISYITSHKGRFSDLKRCLGSVKIDCRDLNLDWEHLIALDGCNEKEATKIRLTFEDKNTKLFNSTENIGKAAWVNKLINKSKGDVIFFLDSDDFLIIGRTYQQFKHLQDNTDLDCIGSNYLRWDRKSTFTITEYPKDDITIKKYFWKYPYLLYSSLAIKANSYNDNGLYFRNDLRGGIDYEFYSRLLANCKVANLNKPLVVYSQSNDGITSKRSTRIAQLKAHEEVLKKLFGLEGYDSTDLASLMMKYILNQLDTSSYCELQHEINNYLSAVDKNLGDHRYFKNFINTHDLSVLLREI